jgi:Putative zinc binding domain
MHWVDQDRPAMNLTNPPRRLCRLCGAPLTTTFVNRGMSPLCESFVTADEIDQMELVPIPTVEVIDPRESVS